MILTHMEHDSGVFFGKQRPHSLSDPPRLSLSLTLVVRGDVAEQVGHGLSVVDAPDGLSQYHADVHSLDFGTL